MPEHVVVSQGRGWLPSEIWLMIVEVHAPPARSISPIMDTPSDEADDFDPSIASSVSCADFDEQLRLSSLSRVNKQLRALLYGRTTHTLRPNCLAVANENARSVRQRLASASSTAKALSARHVMFILYLVPRADEALDDYACILRLIKGISIISIGAAPLPGARNTAAVVDLPSKPRFLESFRSRSNDIIRAEFMDGASFIFAGGGWTTLGSFGWLRTLTFHRRFHDSEVQALLGATNAVVHVLDPGSAFTGHLRRVIIDSPDVRYQVVALRCTHFHEHLHQPYGLLRNGRRHTLITHLSLVMATGPGALNIALEINALRERVPGLRYLRLSALLSQLTTTMDLVPASVRTLVLVVDIESVAWNTQLPLAETVASERLRDLLKGITRVKRQLHSQLERVQFLQSTLVDRIRLELIAHEDVRQEIAEVGVMFFDGKNELLW